LDVAIERELGQRFGGILVTGDVTWRADPREFDLAIAELVRLNQSRSPYRIAVVPGNHDLAFSPNPAEKDTPVTVTDASARAAWERGFYEKLFYIAPPEHLASGRRFLVGNAVPVEVACLNSSHLQQHKEAFQGHGFIGDDQLEAVERGMGWADRPPRDLPFRVVMLHHHVVPVTHREIPRLHGNYSVVLDAVALLRWCVRHGVRLVLHGHMHQPHVTRLSLRRDDGRWHTLTIAAMGSSGVESSHLGEVAKNTVGTLRFGDDAVDLRFWTIHRTNPTEELERLAVRVPYREG
jgi:3',5'-cyclic AMP phosphodiesterase CpdA